MARHDEPRTWWSRNWGWCVGCGCLLPLIAVGLLIGGGAWTAKRMVGEHPAIVEAMERLNADARATEALGRPIRAKFFSENTTIRFDGGDDSALEVRCGVEGPDGAGSVEFRAVPEGEDVWRFETLRLRLDGGDSLDLLEPPGVSGADAPRSRAASRDVRPRATT